ncbi:MAG TPA: hypothetical protein VGE47_13905, partial [Burkholderiaceae bacterium]
MPSATSTRLATPLASTRSAWATPASCSAWARASEPKIRPSMIDSPRPDPDALLAQLREDEAAARRGKLRIYFGSSAGVGKTYAML